jgi:hypothetical protein
MTPEQIEGEWFLRPTTQVLGTPRHHGNGGVSTNKLSFVENNGKQAPHE